MAFYDLNMNSKRINDCQDPSANQDVATKNYIDTILSGYMKQVKVVRFTASGTWTVPAGVTYAVAHIKGGGGGIGTSVGGAGNGGDSSVAFTSGTVTAEGGLFNNSVLRVPPFTTVVYRVGAGRANSGQGAFMTSADDTQSGTYGGGQAQNGAEIVAGADVAFGEVLTVTVGLGGTAGTSGASGGSGYVWIEYY